MKHPTEVKIISKRPFIGKIIVAYKKLIKLLIDPFLRNAFDVVIQEYDFLDHRLKHNEFRLDAAEMKLHSLENANSRLDATEMKLHSLENANSRLDATEMKLHSLENANNRLDKIEGKLRDNLNDELIKRMDSITILLNQRMDEVTEDLSNSIKKDILERTDTLFTALDQRLSTLET